MRPTCVRVLVACSAAVLAFVAMLLVSVFGVFQGVLGLVVFLVLWLMLPSATRLSRRLAINGALGFGVFPLFWWVHWPTFAGIGRVGIATAVMAAVTVGMVSMGGATRRRVLPQVVLVDWIPVAAGAIMAWFFWPFFQYRAGVSGVSMLVQGFGKDNVAHFDMFMMIRRNGVAGTGWPLAPDGSSFAYDNYPQHFHVLVAMVAEAWQGSRVGTTGSETWLFGFGTAIVLGVALVGLVAAVVSIQALRDRFLVTFVTSVGIISLLFFGPGASSLAMGFPGYLLAIMAVLTAVVLAISRKRVSWIDLLASAAMVVLAAHSWMLLAPLALVPFAFVAMRLPWRRYRRGMSPNVVPIVIMLGMSYVVGVGIVLVLDATEAAGPPAVALGTPGGVAASSFPLTIALGIALLGISLALTFRPSPGRFVFSREAPALPVVAFALVAALEAGGLIAIQLRSAGSLSYFQYKFVNSLTLLFGVLLVVVACLWIARLRTISALWYRTIASSSSLVASCLVLFLYSGLLANPQAPWVGLVQPGMQFRQNLGIQASAPGAIVNGVLNASQVMATWPCARPVYVAFPPGDLSMGDANSWAMSLSSTWTKKAGAVNTELFSRHVEAAPAESAKLVEDLLSQDVERCVIVDSDARARSLKSQFSEHHSRILSWAANAG